MQRTLAGQAADTYVLASAERIGAISPYTVLELQSVAGIITDVNHQTLASLRDAGVRLIT